MSAVGLLQHGSVLAGAAEQLQHTQSVTAHRDLSPAQDIVNDMPASSQQALAQHFDPFSWPSQAAQAAQEHPMPGKRSAEAAGNACAFLAERQSKRQRLQAVPSNESSSQQLALTNNVQSQPFQSQFPVPLPRTHAFHSSLGLPLPSPDPIARPQPPFKRQGTPMPSRFAKAAAQPSAFAKPIPSATMFARPVASAGPFSMGTTRQGTPRPQQRADRSGLAPSRSGRSTTTANGQEVNAVAYPSFR